MILGNGGPGDRIYDGRVLPVRYITSIDTTIGGSDIIATGLGSQDIVLGGVDDDVITTNRGEREGSGFNADGTSIVFGDNGLIDYTRPSTPIRPTSTAIWSIDPDTVAATRSPPATATTS